MKSQKHFLEKGASLLKILFPISTFPLQLQRQSANHVTGQTPPAFATSKIAVNPTPTKEQNKNGIKSKIRRIYSSGDNARQGSTSRSTSTKGQLYDQADNVRK
jgi:hypothetical protein